LKRLKITYKGFSVYIDETPFHPEPYNIIVKDDVIPLRSMRDVIGCIDKMAKTGMDAYMKRTMVYYR